MYSISKNGIEIGICEQPTYIRLQDNGAFGLCSEEEAQGIAYENTVYHVYGMPEIEREGIEDVALVEFNGGARILEQQTIIDALLGATAETEVSTDE